jgi:hypothetical protein
MGAATPAALESVAAFVLTLERPAGAGVVIIVLATPAPAADGG